MEDEVVAHPEGIETELFGEAGSLDEQILIRLEAEVRDKQAESGQPMNLFLAASKPQKVSQGSPRDPREDSLS
jgi:hypothetical protein